MPGTGKKILIIEDEIDLCLLLKGYFVRKHYDVLTAHSLADGKDLLNAHHPDILFLDNNLPDGTGWGFAPVIAADFPGIYIVLMGAMNTLIPEMPSSARFQVIEKPISFNELDRQFSKFS